MLRAATILAALLALPSPQRAVTIAGGAIQPHLAAAEDGSFYAVFIKDGNIEFSGSSDRGKTWSSPIVAIDARGKAKGGMQRGPGSPSTGRRRSTSAPRFASTRPSSPSSTLLRICFCGFDGRREDVFQAGRDQRRPQAGPRIAPLAGGGAERGCLRGVAGPPAAGNSPGQDLGYVKITDQGRKVGKNGVIPGPLCECCAPGLTVDAKGNPILIYREGGKSNRPLDLAMSTNGGASFARVTRINQGESKVDS
jgi:hypothetical protein